MSPVQSRLLQMYKNNFGVMSSKEAFLVALNSEWIAEHEVLDKMRAHFNNECNVFLNYACLLELNGE